MGRGPFSQHWGARPGEAAAFLPALPFACTRAGDIFAQNGADAKHFPAPLSAKAGLSA